LSEESENGGCQLAVTNDVSNACHDAGANSKMAPVEFFESRTATVLALIFSSTQLLRGVHRLDLTHRLVPLTSDESWLIDSRMIKSSSRKHCRH
jgi:hypothetical protein